MLLASIVSRIGPMLGTWGNADQFMRDSLRYRLTDVNFLPYKVDTTLNDFWLQNGYPSGA